VSSTAAQEILVRGARALAHADPRGSGLENLLAAVADQLDVESAAIIAPDPSSGRLVIVSSIGLGDPAVAGLTEALRDPDHPIARTLGDPVPTFDVLPTRPGGPALRSHLPLMVTRDGSNAVLGVLALAHHHPLEADARQLLVAAADLAAVALETGRPTG
jgi:GAF domain-containing protein